MEEDDFGEDMLEENLPELYEHYRFTADKGQSLLRIDKFLTDRIEGVSRNRIQLAADAGYILANNVSVKSNYRVKPLDIITIVMDRPRREVEIIPEDIPIHILYEDDDLLIVNKQAGLVVHPGHGNYTGTLLNALACHFRNQRGFDLNDPSVGLVHRIDRNTSGLLLVAKNPEAKTHLSRQFFEKTTKRQYQAIVWGIIDGQEGTITGNIGRNPKDRQRFMVFPDGDAGKHAVTHYSVVERLGYVTQVQCQLETGRTHQIRVHLKYIGHPLFNDERYGGNEILKGTVFSKYRQFVMNCFDICPRQALHAQTLGFIHPTTGKEMFFSVDFPDDMRLLIERWRLYTKNRINYT
jgi:23S rRNA pseudouridine1911/1915/1917 synthase